MFNLRNDFFIDPFTNEITNHDFFFGEEGFDVVKIDGFERFHSVPSFHGSQSNS